MLPALVALVLGVAAGLDMLGVWAPVSSGHLDDVHGILLVLGFLGTLIAAERAVALGHPLGYAATLALGAGGMLLVVPGTSGAASTLIVLGAAALIGLYVPLWRRQRDDAVLVQSLGAVLALGAVVLWRGGVPVSGVLAWLAGFLVLTIAGERLELARLAVATTAARDLVLLALGLCVGSVAMLLWPAPGAVIVGVLMLAVSGWLARHDVARRTVRSSGLPRYMAACMRCGQAWLATAAGVWVLAGPVTAGPTYDAVVHAVFLGFTMSMVMAHAPVILSAVTRVRLPYHPAMYGPPLLLQVSLLLRLWLGDALGLEVARQAGGIGNAIAILSFFAVAVWAAARRGSA
jgi:hypothetical protein